MGSNKPHATILNSARRETFRYRPPLTPVVHVPDALGANRRNLTALGVAALLIAVALVLAPRWNASPLVQYAAYLTLFSLWMAWFVATSVAWLREMDDRGI